jgi:ATP-dependent helicase HrpB
MSLPIDSVLPQLQHALQHNRSAVLQAPPGAGKTTRVPLALLSAPWLEGRKIVMLEPRRLAARAAARFMSAQLGDPVGRTVGYRMRLDSRVSSETRIEVVTEGVLSRLLQDDPSLERYACVIFDEFHERSLQADLGLALTLEVQEAMRDDLRILVMSATLDAAPVARLLGDAPLIRSEGRSYPVEVRYLPPQRVPPEQHLAETIHQALRQESGSILVFLPGGAEIRRLARMLHPRLPPNTFIAPLLGELDLEAQDAAIAPAPSGQRKIVLATAIAETSLTIEGVRIVVDAGLSRRAAFDPVSGLSRLIRERASQAAAEQRKGRAGRLDAGVCYRLWSQEEHARLAAFSTPEILDADLSGLVLELAQWGALTPDTLTWLNPPPAPAWSQARTLLQQLQALGPDGRISEHGRTLRSLPLHPRLAHMLVRGRALGWGRLAAELAALLSERDLLNDTREADMDLRVAALRGRNSPISHNRLLRARDNARRLQTGKADPSQPETADAIGTLLGYAYPERIAQRRGDTSRFLLANGRGAFLNEQDPLRAAPFIVAAELDGDPRNARIFLAAEISQIAIEQHFGQDIEKRETIAWDEASAAVQARRQRCYGALILNDAMLPSPDPDRLAEALATGIRQSGLQALPWTHALRQWQARVMLSRQLMPESWPDVSEPALLETLEHWLMPFAQGLSRLSPLNTASLEQALNLLLDHDQQRRLATEAPTHCTVPSGSRIAIDYLAGDTPVLPVKLQEMFGQLDTPRIANGRMPLTLHLLSPAQRPVQVTQDLAGFWRGAYADVRKELRGRYPRHPWPEDPLTAPPARGVKRR